MDVMNKVGRLLLLVFVNGWLADVCHSYPMIPAISSEQLLSAPIIVIGKIQGMNNVGGGIIKDTVRGHGDVLANVFELNVAVSRSIKGKTGGEIQVGGLLAPADLVSFGYLYENQIPNPASQNNHVLFISFNTNAAKYVPAFSKEFAIEIERYPETKTDSFVEALRNIAKANVEATNYVLAVRWAEFLSGLPDDQQYWVSKTDDARILIKSAAYAKLVQEFPETPGLRARLIQNLSNPDPSVEDSDVWVANYSLIASLKKLFEKTPPEAMEIKDLLGSGDRNVDEMALKMVRDGNVQQLTNEVVHLMVTTKDQGVQYVCFKTLSALTGDLRLISQPTFLEKPDYYVKEWEKIIYSNTTGRYR